MGLNDDPEHWHSTGGSTPFRHGEPSDLFRLCLREEARDPARFLAWANSICLLFLVVGLIGLWSPPVRVQTSLPRIDSVPVVWTAPEPERKIGSLLTTSIGQAEIPLESSEAFATEIPEVASVASVAAPEKIAFPALPALDEPSAGHGQSDGVGQHYVPVRPTAFQPTSSGAEASTPPPEYPPRALRNGREGTAIIEFSVNPAGQVHSVRVRTSSGYGELDDAALAVVRDKWRFGPGAPRSHFWACTFQIKRSEK
jgi:protein TonB